MPNFTRKRKRSEESILDQLEALRVAKVEFELDALSDKQESENSIVMTPGLHTFWKGSGDFPSSYFVRKEEVVFWQVVKGMLPIVEKKEHRNGRLTWCWQVVLSHACGFVHGMC